MFDFTRRSLEQENTPVNGQERKFWKYVALINKRNPFELRQAYKRGINNIY